MLNALLILGIVAVACVGLGSVIVWATFPNPD